MENKELILKIKDLFNSYNFTAEYLSKPIFSGKKTNFNVDDFDKIASDLCRLFNPDQKEFSIKLTFPEKSKRLIRIVKDNIDLNNDYYSVSIFKFYPKIISNHFDNIFNLKEFDNVYRFLVENYKEMRNEEYGFTMENKWMLNIVVNGVYGYCFIYNTSNVSLLNGERIVVLVNQITNEINDKFSNISQIFCDEFICNDLETANNVVDYIKEKYPQLKLEFDVEKCKLHYDERFKSRKFLKSKMI